MHYLHYTASFIGSVVEKLVYGILVKFCCWFGVVVTALVTSKKLSYVEPSYDWDW